VNILPAEHRHLAAQFSRSGTDKFAGVDYSALPLGNPVLDQALARVDCELHKEYDGGDHTIVVGDAARIGWAQMSDPTPSLKVSGRGGAGIGSAKEGQHGGSAVRH
jgi:3-hydroxy-9,10-secoandrosta-1,3,5(10)-triene-9,17-dione monooxygenase reductase component